MDIERILSQMTLEEKAGLCSGLDFWHTKPVERLGVPSMMVSDGPHGLRKQDLKADHLGINNSIKAVCFPTGAATACSFDRELLFSMGEALGTECQAEDVGVILGPGANIKRSPLCGRNFEYFSEDPYLSSQMAGSHIRGVESQGVGVSLKHFAANSQEHRRMTASSNMDERTLREIYLASFEGAVKQGKPWTVMCSYNRVNGVYASENAWLMTDVLRKEWGFDGVVVSDWGAVNDRVEGLKAGLELEMPASGGETDAAIVQAVRDGSLEESVLDEACRRLLKLIDRYASNHRENVAFPYEEHHALARRIAGESMVLLKNNGILPLRKGEKIAFIGKFAAEPRYQGGGSSHINSYKVTSALEAAKDIANITYAQGYDTKEDKVDEALLAEAVKTAREADAAVLFVGLPDAFESEGYDRKHMDMPVCQNALIDAVAAVQPNTVIVLHNGSPVTMPWAEKVSAILEAYLGGQAVGGAQVDLLFGDVNPSGKLAESIPYTLEDNSSYLFYPGEMDNVEYREGIFVGYRYYDRKKAAVRYPFGYGLSYTTFVYSNLRLSADRIKDTDTLEVALDVTNTGSVKGKEIVQIYIADKASTLLRPVKELKEFAKVELEPGETKTVTFTLDKRAFAYYNTDIRDWHVESGEFTVMAAASSLDIRLTKDVYVESTVRLPVTFAMTSTVGDILRYPEVYHLFRPILEANIMDGDDDSENDKLGEGTREMMEQMMQNMPLRSLCSFSQGKLTREGLEKILAKVNRILG